MPQRFEPAPLDVLGAAACTWRAPASVSTRNPLKVPAASRNARVLFSMRGRAYRRTSNCSGSSAATSKVSRHDSPIMTAPTMTSDKPLPMKDGAGIGAETLHFGDVAVEPAHQVAHRTRARRRGETRSRCAYTIPRSENSARPDARHIHHAMDAAEHETRHGERQHAEAGARQARKLPPDESLIDDDPREQRLRRRQCGDEKPQQQRQDQCAELRPQMRPQQPADAGTPTCRG